MKRDHTDPAAVIQKVDHGVKTLRQRCEFPVELDSQRLESPLRGMSSCFLEFHRDRSFYDRDELPSCLDFVSAPRFHDVLCDIRCKTLFPIVPDYARKFTLGRAVHDIRRSPWLSSVHAHVERRVCHIGKATFRSIQLMRGYPKIKKYTVTSFKALLSQYFRHLAVVAAHDPDFIPIRGKLFRGSLYGRVIPVNTDQSAGVRKSLTDLLRMARSAKRSVNVNAVLADIKIVHRFIKQHR